MSPLVICAYNQNIEIEMLRHILWIVTFFKQWLINLRVQSTYSNLYFLKYCQIMVCWPKLRLKSTLPTSNAIMSEHWIEVLSRIQTWGGGFAIHVKNSDKC